MRSPRRSLAWGKEVERRARDLYRRIWPEVERAARLGREDREGHPDLVNLPIHVQVKARHATWVGSEWRRAKNASEGKVTHLVTQDAGGPLLVTMKLSDYIEDLRTGRWVSPGG
jgi:hypothetical protein